MSGCRNQPELYNLPGILPDSTVRSAGAPPSATDIRLDADTLDILRRVSRTPIEPTPEHELMADLGYDSLLVLELVGELEHHFNIAVPLNNLTHIRTVGHIIAEVRRLVAERGPTA